MYSILSKERKKISSGFLNCGQKVFEKIYNEFEFKDIDNRKMLADFENVEIDKEDLMIKYNYTFPIINSGMLSIFVILLLLLTSGFNYKYDSQDKFQLSGTVVYKEIEKTKNSDSFKITIIENNSPKEYKINVNSKVYEQFDINNKINIIGKIGSLGILYDINYSKENT